MTFVHHLETTSITLGNQDPVTGHFSAVATTTIAPNNRGEFARIRTQFVQGVPAETETVPGVGAWKRGEILCQHQMHDGRGKNRLAITGHVDSAGGLSWVIDSTTVDPSGSQGQDESAPVVINVGEANGVYLVLHADGRIKFRRGKIEFESTVDKIEAALR